jgi:Fe-S cluster assembly protein SufD
MARSATRRENGMNAVLDFPVKPEARPYIDAFAPSAGDPEWLAAHRRRSLARFAELGFPSRRSEAWRYLDLRGLEAKPAQRAAPLGAAIAARDRLDDIGLAGPRHRLVLVDACFSPALSGLSGAEAPPAGVWLGAMARAIDERPELVRPSLEAAPYAPARPFAALNAAYFADGFVLDIAPGVVLDRPVEIVHLGSGSGSLHTRSLVNLGAGSRAVVLETFAGAGSYWRNDVVELRLGNGAALERVVLVEEAEEAVHLGETVASLAREARLTGFVLLLGGRTVRHEATVRCDGERTRCDLNGVFVISGRQEANLVTTVDHAAPRGETGEVVKGVAAGRAHGAFQGRIIVRKDAQQVDARQLSRNLLLSPRAAIDTKPELEILADDVKCSHGAAVGDLDDEALFYLRSRGIPEGEARRLLIDAFVRDAVELVDDAALREHLLARLARRLAVLEE